MSDPHTLFKTGIIISPDEQVSQGVREGLPIHINVVDPFIASRTQTDRLMKAISAPLFRNTFEITGFEHRDRGVERLQRLGGSVLHGLHDDIVSVLDRTKIVHDNTPWEEGTVNTWYSGTWQVPDHRLKVGRVHVIQEIPEHQQWQILHTYQLKTPNIDFREDEYRAS